AATGPISQVFSRKRLGAIFRSGTPFASVRARAAAASQQRRTCTGPQAKVPVRFLAARASALSGTRESRPRMFGGRSSAGDLAPAAPTRGPRGFPALGSRALAGSAPVGLPL